MLGKGPELKSYCLASLLSVVSKFFEKLVNNGIFDLLEKCSLFPDFQYDFKSSGSTTYLLTVVSARIGAVQAVALDISKAFDRV